MPPGSRLLAFTSRWFDPATVHRTFEPLVADWQREWTDAPHTRRLAIHIKGLTAFCVAAIVSTPVVLRTRSPRSFTDRVVRRIAWTTAIGTAVMMAPFGGGVGRSSAGLLLLLSAIPPAMALAFPFAMIMAVDVIRRADDIAPHVSRATTARLAMFAVVFMALLHGWVVPAANQAWRVAALDADMTARGLDPEIARHSGRPMKGVRELTTYELMTAPELASTDEPRSYRFAAKTVWIEINNRATLAVLPVFLLWRRWRTLDLPSGRWFSPRHPIPATIVAIAMFISCRGFFNSVEHVWSLPAGSGAWAEFACLALLGMTRVWLVERSAARA